MKRKPPRTDFDAQRYIAKEIKRLYIGAEERRERVKAAMKVRGIKSLNELAMRMGSYAPTTRRMVEVDNVKIESLLRACVVLNVPLSYLTEREIREG